MVVGVVAHGGDVAVCQISPIADDWVKKGFHLRVYGVELAMRPDHNGRIIFRECFQSTSDQDAEAATNRAMELLNVPRWRKRFRLKLLKAREYLREHEGRLAALARGRGAEFTFLIAALRRMENASCQR